MRINLTKKDLVNLVYMQLGFSKQISENLIEDFLSTIVSNIKREKKLKLSKFGTFSIRQKKSRIGRNPKTKETKMISSRDVVLFKPSKEFKDFVNLKSNKKGELPTHIIRFWETQFKQIKPKILNSNRRYYDEDCINLLKKVKFLLKEQGMTINGVKKILNGDQSLELDEMANNSIKADNLRNKLVKISKIVKNLKDLK